MTDQDNSLITDEIVEKALGITQPGLLERQRYPSAVKAARERMRAALEAVQGDIIENFGASGTGASTTRVLHAKR